MRFAKLVFLVAGIYGLLVLTPMYFLEPPGVPYPEFYYGFIGVAVAWQVAFLVISRDPLRFRPLIPAALIEKFSYGAAVFVLAQQDRVGPAVIPFAFIDVVLGVLFAVAFFRTASLPAQRPAAPPYPGAATVD
jgi:hypothetical protein